MGRRKLNIKKIVLDNSEFISATIASRVSFDNPNGCWRLVRGKKKIWLYRRGEYQTYISTRTAIAVIWLGSDTPTYIGRFQTPTCGDTDCVSPAHMRLQGAVCEAPGCTRTSVKMGLCDLHIQRFRKRGDLKRDKRLCIPGDIIRCGTSRRVKVDKSHPLYDQAKHGNVAIGRFAAYEHSLPTNGQYSQIKVIGDLSDGVVVPVGKGAGWYPLACSACGTEVMRPAYSQTKKATCDACRSAGHFPNKRLGDDDLRLVFEMRTHGATNREIANHVGVTQSSISGIMLGRIYRRRTTCLGLLIERSK